MSRKPQQIEEQEEDDYIAIPGPPPRSYIEQVECQADAAFRYGDMQEADEIYEEIGDPGYSASRMKGCSMMARVWKGLI